MRSWREGERKEGRKKEGRKRRRKVFKCFHGIAAFSEFVSGIRFTVQLSPTKFSHSRGRNSKRQKKIHLKTSSIQLNDPSHHLSLIPRSFVVQMHMTTDPNPFNTVPFLSKKDAGLSSYPPENVSLMKNQFS